MKYTHIATKISSGNTYKVCYKDSVLFWVSICDGRCGQIKGLFTNLQHWATKHGYLLDQIK